MWPFLLLENFNTLSATFIVLDWMHFPLDLFHYSYQLFYRILLSITKKYLYIIYFICLFLTSIGTRYIYNVKII